jgi:hypothetical protein
MAKTNNVWEAFTTEEQEALINYDNNIASYLKNINGDLAERLKNAEYLSELDIHTWIDARIALKMDNVETLFQQLASNWKYNERS